MSRATWCSNTQQRATSSASERRLTRRVSDMLHVDPTSDPPVCVSRPLHSSLCFQVAMLEPTAILGNGAPAQQPLAAGTQTEPATPCSHHKISGHEITS